MTAPDLKCECGTVLADGGPVGLYCPNRDCRIEADLVAKVFKAMRERNTRAVDPAAIREGALREAADLLFTLAGEKGGTKTPQGRTAQYYARRILALIPKGAAHDRAPLLGTCACGMTGPCMWDQCKHPLAKGAADDRA